MTIETRKTSKQNHFRTRSSTLKKLLIAIFHDHKLYFCSELRCGVIHIRLCVGCRLAKKINYGRVSGFLWWCSFWYRKVAKKKLQTVRWCITLSCWLMQRSFWWFTKIMLMLRSSYFYWFVINTSIEIILDTSNVNWINLQVNKNLNTLSVFLFLDHQLFDVHRKRNLIKLTNFIGDVSKHFWILNLI